jgi:ankyrin repeat protein
MASNILHLALDGCMTSEEIIHLFLYCDHDYKKLANEPDAKGNYPLFIACQQICYESIAMKLYEEYPESLQRHGWDNNRNPLHIACKLGDIETVKSIMSRNSYLNLASDAYGRTPIFYACQFDQVSVLELLLDIDNDINQQDIYGQSVLHKSCIHGSSKAINKLLLYPNINIYVIDNDGNTAFYYLVRYWFSVEKKSRYKNMIATLKRFLELYPDCFHYRHSDRRSLFHDIISNRWFMQKRMTSFMKLINISTLVNEADEMGLTPLHLTCQYNKEELDPLLYINFFTRKIKGVLVNQTDNEGKTALHYAIMNGFYLTYLTLRGNYPDIKLDIQDNFGNTLLHLALGSRGGSLNDDDDYKVELIEYILEKHLHLVMRTNNAGDTPYHIALRNKEEKIENDSPRKKRRIINQIRILEDATARLRMQMFLYLLE